MIKGRRYAFLRYFFYKKSMRIIHNIINIETNLGSPNIILVGPQKEGSVEFRKQDIFFFGHISSFIHAYQNSRIMHT